ncbi:MULTISPECIES: hypothetical protein [Azotobacter]|uniref:hypothetical protein n=1 Tax=Azotobacter TaxID=352 RepID=UPI00093001E5|nr:hypothetical protein [Azotobacter vinelandii]WKN20000.1 hypothetical protein AVAEIV_002930 [Azotobacter vinelandii]
MHLEEKAFFTGTNVFHFTIAHLPKKQISPSRSRRLAIGAFAMTPKRSLDGAIDHDRPGPVMRL